MTKRIVIAACAASVLSLSAAAAQSSSSQTGTQTNRETGTSTQQEMTIVGCVARGTGGTATYMLNNVQMGTGATASAGVSGSTSARPGTSTSGTTSSTTTGTAGSSTTTGTGTTDQGRTTQRPGQTTSGTASAQTGTASMPSSYMLVAGANQNLTNYVGQRVEIRGHVVSNAAESNRNTTPGSTPRAGESTSPPAGSSNERSANNASRFQVASIRSIAGTCQ